MPQASVIVPVRDAQATLARTLTALADQDAVFEYEVIVVDDASSDASAEIARMAEGPVSLLHARGQGPAAARNLGVRAARAARLAFCDADVFPTQSWLREGIGCLEEADLVQGRVLPDPRAGRGPFDRTLSVSDGGGLWETASLFVSRELFERLGGFRFAIAPRRGKQLGEDVVFGYRAQRAGARTGFCAAALAHHAVFARGWAGYVAERARLVHFPALARAVPEMRQGFLHRRLFLDRRSARLDLALLATGLAATARTPWPVLATAPYLLELHRHARRAASGRAGRAGPAAPDVAAVAAADLAADLVGLAAMIAGSLRHGVVVL